MSFPLVFCESKLLIKVLKQIKLAIHLILEQLFLGRFLHHFKVFEVEKYFAGLDNLPFDKIMFLSFSLFSGFVSNTLPSAALQIRVIQYGAFQNNKRIAWACEGAAGREEYVFERKEK